MDSAYATIMHFVHLRSCKVQLHLFWMESPYISVQVPLPRVAGEIFKCNNNYYPFLLLWNSGNRWVEVRDSRMDLLRVTWSFGLFHDCLCFSKDLIFFRLLNYLVARGKLEMEMIFIPLSERFWSLLCHFIKLNWALNHQFHTFPLWKLFSLCKSFLSFLFSFHF